MKNKVDLRIIPTSDSLSSYTYKTLKKTHKLSGSMLCTQIILFSEYSPYSATPGLVTTHCCVLSELSQFRRCKDVLTVAERVRHVLGSSQKQWNTLKAGNVNDGGFVSQYFWVGDKAMYSQFERKKPPSDLFPEANAGSEGRHINLQMALVWTLAATITLNSVNNLSLPVIKCILGNPNEGQKAFQ